MEGIVVSLSLFLSLVRFLCSLSDAVHPDKTVIVQLIIVRFI